LKDAGASGSASIESGVAERCFGRWTACPAASHVGDFEDVFGSFLLRLGEFLATNEGRNLSSGLRVVSVIDASYFKRATPITGGEFIDGEATIAVPSSFYVKDVLADFNLVRRSHCFERLTE
jgi:hypothetical protein